MKSLKNLIFSDAFREGVKHAVKEAIMEADAKGLPKAYEPYFSEAEKTCAPGDVGRPNNAIEQSPQ